jgi:hypothetical protein
MKWKTPIKPPKYARRIVYRYAFWPIKCDDGITVLFEKYWVEQMYERIDGGISLFTNSRMGWVDQRKSSMPMFKDQEKYSYFSVDL